MNYRASHHEIITGKSPLIRDRFPTKGEKSDGGGGDDNGDDRAGRGGGRYGIATVAKPLSIEGIRKALNHELRAQGLRGLLPEGETRHPVKQAHGFRKFFFSRAIGAGMIHDNVEYLMGHRSGNQASYFKPEAERALLQDYLKAVDALTINFDNHKATFQMQVAELKEKSKEESYFVIGKLAEKEKEAEDTKKRLADLEQRFEQLIQFNQRRVVSHELELRRLKGKGTNAPLTKEDVEDILRWEEYHDCMEEEYAQKQQRIYEEEQRRLYEKYLQQEDE